MSGAVKAAIAGGVIAVVLAVGAIAALTTGLVAVPMNGSQPDRMVVIATAPAEDGSEFAPLAYVADPATGQVTLLDSLEDATVSGTSAKTAAEALAFGGGDAVASALKAQTGGEALEWILIPSSAWANLIDRAGGVTVDVPVGVSAYGNGQLTLLAPGRKELTGAEAVALATAIRYAGTPEQQREVLRQLTAGVSAIAGARGSTLRDLVGQSKASSSLPAEKIPALSSVQ